LPDCAGQKKQHLCPYTFLSDVSEPNSEWRNENRKDRQLYCRNAKNFILFTSWTVYSTWDTRQSHHRTVFHSLGKLLEHRSKSFAVSTPRTKTMNE
jgi:hypothetical protein